MSGERRAPGLVLIEILMRAYPRAFLDRFGEAMKADAGQALRESRLRGWQPWLRALLFWCGDVVLSGLAERREQRRARGRATSPDAVSGVSAVPAASRSGPRYPSQWLATLRGDLVHAIRRLRRAPGFSAVVVATLALGIGLTTSAFHLAYSTVLRPLGYTAPDRLVRITMLGEGGAELTKVSAPDVVDWSEAADGFDSFAGVDFGLVTFSSGNSEPEVVLSASGTADVFSVLRVSPSIGRLFGASDDMVDGVVLSYAFWRSRFGGDPAVLGQSVEIDSRARRVIGVLPPDFEDPATGDAGQAQVWLPLTESSAGARASRWLNGIARLSDGVSVERASQELTAVAASLATTYPDTNGGLSTRVVPLREALWGEARAPLTLLVIGTGFILLIACSNLANLLFARGATRRGEFAIRRAIGAGRGDVLRQLAVETAVLAIAGGALGLGLTWLASVALGEALDGRLQRIAATPGAAVFVFGALLTLAAALLIGLLPGVRAVRLEPGDALKESGRSGAVGRGSRRIRHVLVGGQMALALMLMVGAALLLRSFDHLMRVDPGFDAAGLLVFELVLPSAAYADEGAVLRTQAELLERLDAIPGARAGAVDKLPFGTRWGCRPFSVDGQPTPQRAEDWPCAESRSASPRYTDALGVPLVRGRQLAASDVANAQPVVVVNATFAQMTWPQSEAIGHRIAWWGGAGTEPVWRTVVGVVGDVHHRGLDVPPQPEVYMPYEQAPDRRMGYVVRAADIDVTTLGAAVRAAVHEVDPRLPLRNLRSFESTISESVAGMRTGLFSVLGLSALALVLAVVGIFGLLAYFVAQRVPEIGLRMALGADARSITRLFVGEGMRTAVIGLFCGLIATLALTRLMASVLFEVQPNDAVSIAAVSILLLAVAAIACWLPARRALQVDPTTALRNGP